MKTLEQAMLDSEHPDSFKAGVEFARRWISTEEELPQNSDADFFEGPISQKIWEIISNLTQTVVSKQQTIDFLCKKIY